jgi:hypothetical protein
MVNPSDIAGVLGFYIECRYAASACAIFGASMTVSGQTLLSELTSCRYPDDVVPCGEGGKHSMVLVLMLFLSHEANEESNYAATKFDVSACRAHARKLAVVVVVFVPMVIKDILTLTISTQPCISLGDILLFYVW